MGATYGLNALLLVPTFPGGDRLDPAHRHRVDLLLPPSHCLLVPGWHVRRRRFLRVSCCSHFAAGSFLHSLDKNVLSNSSGLMRCRQDLQGNVRPLAAGYELATRCLHAVIFPEFVSN